MRSKHSRVSPTAVIAKTRSQGITRYQQLYGLLSQALIDGQFKGALPSEPELARAYQIARTTVRRALDALEREGRIVRIRGSGTYPSAASRQLIQQFWSIISVLNGGSCDQREVTAKLMSPRELRGMQALIATHAELGADVIGLHQRCDADGYACALSNILIPRQVVDERGLFGAHANVQRDFQKLTREVNAIEPRVTAITADAIIARRLKIEIGAAVLRIRHSLRNHYGELIAVVETLLRPGQSCLTDTVRLKQNGKTRQSSWTLGVAAA